MYAPEDWCLWDCVCMRCPSLSSSLPCKNVISLFENNSLFQWWQIEKNDKNTQKWISNFQAKKQFVQKKVKQRWVSFYFSQKRKIENTVKKLGSWNFYESPATYFGLCRCTMGAETAWFSRKACTRIPRDRSNALQTFGAQIKALSLKNRWRVFPSWPYWLFPCAGLLNENIQLVRRSASYGLSTFW